MSPTPDSKSRIWETLLHSREIWARYIFSLTPQLIDFSSSIASAFERCPWLPLIRVFKE